MNEQLKELEQQDWSLVITASFVRVDFPEGARRWHWLVTAGHVCHTGQQAADYSLAGAVDKVYSRLKERGVIQ